MVDQAAEKRRIWSSPKSPSAEVSRLLGIDERMCHRALHSIKRSNGLRGDENVDIFSDGSVKDKHGEELGNIFDED